MGNVVVKDLKKILENNLNKWVVIEFFSPSGVVGEVVGILKEFNDSYLLVENVSKNYINLRGVTIGRIEVRVV